MKTVAILGGGTAGTMVANKLCHTLDLDQWQIILVDRDQTHYYQPGFLFIPFGVYFPHEVLREKRHLIDAKVEVIFSDIEVIEPEKSRVVLSEDKRIIDYDYLVIATGTEIRPDQIEGLMGEGWQQNIFDFYTFEGAVELGDFLQTWEGGRLVINVAKMPIKCPIAPLEFAFLADWFFIEKGMRNKVDIVFVTPLPGAFTQPIASRHLGDLLRHKGITLEPEFNIAEVDNARQVIRSFDKREISYDLLVSIPPNMGSAMIERSGLGDEMNYVPTNKHTLQARDWQNIFVIGDASDVPTSKAGSVAHFMLDVLVENLLHHMHAEPLTASFDGHANCFIETGHHKAILVDFNYDTEPMQGGYPVPNVGPFTLLEESRANHAGKLASKWLYWNIILKGLPMPLPNKLSMAGKYLENV